MIDYRGKQIYLACGGTDMRKGINGLSATVSLSLDFKNAQGYLFVFCNGKRNRLKILEWDGDGFWLYVKRLERGTFPWPSSREAATIKLNEDEFSHLLGGTKLLRKLKRDEFRSDIVV